MFGGSLSQQDETLEASPATSKDNGDTKDSIVGSSQSSDDKNQPGRKRRSSGISRVVQSARNSLHLGNTGQVQEKNEGPQTSALAKLSKADPALTVPQGTNNNSAGESHPTPRSTFRVGVTEDKNKKCRKTMEDTHAYLYNFLSTPAPVLSDAAKDTLTAESSDKSPGAASSSSLISDKVIETDNGYFAIFDGHAGSFAADWCGKKLHLLLEDNIKKSPNTSIPELLDQTFTLADEQLERIPQAKNSGCTAVAAVLRWEDRVPNPQSATGSTAMAPAAAAASNKPSSNTDAKLPVDRRISQTDAALSTATPSSSISAAEQIQKSATRQRVLYTANVGDARIVLCRNGKALRLSYDHKGSDEYETKRISNAGGLILNNRVNGVLAVTRALGDTYMKQLVTGHPYTTETVIQPELDEFIVLACDGVSPLAIHIRCIETDKFQ
jgi:protein phosphatase PTC1